MPYALDDLIADHIGLGLVFLSVSFMLFFTKSKPRADTVSWFLFVVFIFLLTLNSQRFIEYLAPVMVMASALIFRDGWESIKYKFSIKNNAGKRLAYGVVIALFFLVGNYQVGKAKDELIDPRPLGRYQKAALWLMENTPGSTVFNTDWDDFPELFFYNSKNKYVVGLDPAFLKLYDPKLFKNWLDISRGTILEDPYFILKDEFKTPFLFTDTHHGLFTRLMDNHPLIKLEYKDAHARIYSLQPL